MKVDEVMLAILGVVLFFPSLYVLWKSAMAHKREYATFTYDDNAVGYWKITERAPQALAGYLSASFTGIAGFILMVVGIIGRW